MSNGSKFFSVLVVGDNQQELLSEYSMSKKVPQYVKYTYLVFIYKQIIEKQ